MGHGQSTPTHHTAEGAQISLDAGSIAAARADSFTLRPTSNITGHTFDRFIQVFLENQDYEITAGDPSFAEIAKLGITLDNYYAITRPSQPNYVAAVGANTHDIQDNKFHRIDKEQQTIVDLLEYAGVSWSLYQEDMPYSGFEGNYPDPKNGRNAYVRKHNPLMSFDSVTLRPSRLAKCKNFTMLFEDLSEQKLPQWMFITPNMRNNGHDTSITTAGAWTLNFLKTLGDYRLVFDKGRTLIVVTFDESDKDRGNRVFTVLLGSAIPEELKGTTNSTSFTHYSLAKTVEVNWNLGSLHQHDQEANPLF